MKMSWKKGFVAFAFFAFAFATVNEAGTIAHYIASVELGVEEAEQAASDERALLDLSKLDPAERALYDRIVKEGERLASPPIDAKIDPVWKAIPGMNGRTVDVEKTFAAAVSNGKSADEKITYYFKETPARVTLDDLGAQPIYKGNPRKPMASLMINVAWKEENLPGMLETLREENVKATFFFLGSWLKAHPELAKTILAEGHELSNHAFSHDSLTRMSDAAVRKEIEDTQKLLDALGVENKLFAPPSGDYDMDTVRVAHDLGLRTILWTLDTIDWKEPPPESIVRKVRTRIEPGSLILMHPTESAAGALRGIIQEAKRKGLALGTVSETISPSRVPPVETPARF
ncbi:polysaccharide deacetylase family protein [Paenibacillus sp. TRM 82003]|nr:polysaccharide deacetylase family protein [Paenibacillus sp. TRM 82003]